MPEDSIDTFEIGSSFRRTFERVADGFVTPTVVSDGFIAGCVYRSDGSKAAVSERFGGWLGDLFRSNNPDFHDRPSCIARSGKGVYLGSFMSGHYGHFITETLSTFWIFEEVPAEGFDYFLFSPFVFGNRIPDFALKCFGAFGINPDKVMLMEDQAMAFEELWVPERLLRLNHSADPSLRWVYRKISSQSKARSEPFERIYLSRRKLSFRNLTRVIANEVMMEKLFHMAGFKVIYPEELSFDRQLGLYDQACVVAGLSGSALHNSLFMKPGANLIEIGDPRYGGVRAPTQVLCDLVSGVHTSLIPFVGRVRDTENSMLIDVDDLRKNLIRILKDLNLTPYRLERGRIRMSPFNAIEIIYLFLRPMLGAKLRMLCRVFGRR